MARELFIERSNRPENIVSKRKVLCSTLWKNLEEEFRGAREETTPSYTIHRVIETVAHCLSRPVEEFCGQGEVMTRMS